MAKIKDPILFSEHFNIDEAELKKRGIVDPFLNVDTQLFVDPILLDKSSFEVIRTDAYNAFRDHFTKVIRLLIISQGEGDAAWKGAQKLLSLEEPPANGLGYGGSDRAGTSRPEELRDTILRTTKDIIELGARDPEMISLMGFFEEQVGPDTISDLTSRVIEPQLSTLTNEVCGELGIPTKLSTGAKTIALPHYTSAAGKERALVLVPEDIVRALPDAKDWSEIDEAAAANRDIRDRVNALLAGIATPTVAERKEALKRAALQSPDALNALLAALKGITSNYDPNDDALGYYKLKEILSSDLKAFESTKKYDLAGGVTVIEEVVRDTLNMFKQHVEHGNLWEELWIGDKPKKERAAQLIYYAIADSYCEANNIDISPEANMGGGPMDFKYSQGYNARVVVEMKRSSGTVVHGYEKQLEIYKEAARTNRGVFVIMDYGDMGDKLNTIQKIRADRLAAGEQASEIVVIDATPKASASKRK
ncbi:hypothetical protein Q669_19055 [Labrenzia sp. C1B10]|uniref:hypothetical protein n=1 Tax=unclassified Labrenzia TaxID=2648686 RepID=UPI0003B86185|nr:MULTISPECIES: hypothetical protein [unclassified Labrenzia]ERP98407.1 hypothetical protein Q669_19055 [Labrenzia sp. C1B10]ERP99912.1 hypothetical protein Q675_10130 [Labrenzia sp. C1B70]